MEIMLNTFLTVVSLGMVPLALVMFTWRGG
jgi:hypothetical protein